VNERQAIKKSEDKIMSNLPIQFSTQWFDRFIDRASPLLEWDIPIKVEQSTSKQLTFQIKQPVMAWIVGIGFALAGKNAFFHAFSFAHPFRTIIDLPFSLVLLAIAVYLIVLASRVVTYTFDKTSGLMTVTDKSWMSTTTEHYPLGEIWDVQVEKAVGKDAYRLNLSLMNQESLAIPEFYSYGCDSKEAAIATLKSFLYQPTDPASESTPSEDLLELAA
jgi:hypothetical protein